jgi:hypothetical protein
VSREADWRREVVSRIEDFWNVDDFRRHFALYVTRQLQIIVPVHMYESRTSKTTPLLLGLSMTDYVSARERDPSVLYLYMAPNDRWSIRALSKLPLLNL